MTTTTTRRRAATPDSPAAVLAKAERAARRTHWEDTLAAQIRALHLPEPERQAYWHPTRRYRSDFCYRPERLLIEVQGGIWLPNGGGRHNRAQGYEDDCRRTGDALECGWRILPVTPDMVASGEAVARIERVLHTIWQVNTATRTRRAG